MVISILLTMLLMGHEQITRCVNFGGGDEQQMQCYDEPILEPEQPVITVLITE
jgi:hypothetical protein